MIVLKMNEIIRKRRKEMELTQEQVANYLGVTTPSAFGAELFEIMQEKG